MTKQFKVGQVWADRIGNLRIITKIGCEADTFYNITSEASDGQQATHNKDGQVWSHTTIALDLITLVKDTEDNVSNKTKYVKFESPFSPDDKVELQWGTTDSNGDFVPSKLPPEPIPGQYYRTKEGTKRLYIGRTGAGYYLYEDSMVYATYREPYRHLDAPDDPGGDIIALWTDPLPAMEIKQWCVVTATESKWHSRGTSIDTCNSFDRALDVVKESSISLEIVELTGILPAREV
jgi:hypothetical protein